jgi:hypothetical protein
VRGWLHGIPPLSTTDSRIANSQKKITSVTSTRLSSIANMVDLSRDMPVVVLRLCFHGEICRLGGGIPAQGSHGRLDLGVE